MLRRWCVCCVCVQLDAEDPMYNLRRISFVDKDETHSQVLSRALSAMKRCWLPKQRVCAKGSKHENSQVNCKYSAVNSSADPFSSHYMLTSADPFSRHYRYPYTSADTFLLRHFLRVSEEAQAQVLITRVENRVELLLWRVAANDQM